MDNMTLRNQKIRAEISKLREAGYPMKVAISLVAEMFFLSYASVHAVVYDKRRK